MDHLIFYDGQCGLCDRVVQWVIRQDKKRIFLFAPLQGTTAKKVLGSLTPEQKQLDTLILIENFSSKNQHIYLLGKGALRICWLLGGLWIIPGSLSFLPGFFYNWGYRLVARNRHRLFSNDSCVLPTANEAERFLP